MMGGFMAFFLLGTAILLFIMNVLSTDYTKDRTALKEKTLLAQEINTAFNEVFLNSRGYLAYGNVELRDSAVEKKTEIRKMTNRFEKLATTRSDNEALSQIEEFTAYYFSEVLPSLFDKYESGEKGLALEESSWEVMEPVGEFREYLTNYIHELDNELNKRYEKLRNTQETIMIVFIVFIFGILLTVLGIIRIMLIQVGKPLAELAHAANDIANGQPASILLGRNRKDEIGTLSAAFQKMAQKVLEKEQDLLEQNYTLLERKEELHAQQEELEKTLKVLQEHDRKLSGRNELINNMSRSLNKQNVLDSVVSNMSRILKADRGIIVLPTDFSYASEGISSQGRMGFVEHLKSGILDRLVASKGPLLTERRTRPQENGYHTEEFYCQDLYLPVLTAEDELSAVMCFTRFGAPFEQEVYEDWRALSRNIGIALDKIALFEITEKERMLNQHILDTIQEGIQLVDKEGTILQVNAQFCEMFGIQNPDPAGMQYSIWSKKMAGFMEEGRAFLDFLKDSGSMDTCTYKMMETGRVIKVYCKEAWQGSERLGTVYVHRDTTKEFEVDQMKSEFVSTVSHELRTPLASILGFSELMMNRELKPERQKKYVSTIFNEAKRLTGLINDFLDVQKMEAGKMTYEKKPVDVIPILKDVAALHQEVSDKHQIVLEAMLEKAIILGDSDKVGQVFRNLLSNAIKYSPDGGRIKISVYKDINGFTIDVADEGIGIPKESIGKLFTKFYRVDNSDLRKIGGTGLGLAIVNEIVKALGGEVTVKSNQGVGTTFTVTFPHYSPETEQQSREEEQLISGYRVLVVEDDPSLGILICQELEESGFQVTYFSKALPALQYMEQNPPDAVVLDIILEGGGLDGWAIMKKMKQKEALKTIPIIVSSALDEKVKGMKLGAQEYLVKPYKTSQLSKTIMQTLLGVGKYGQIFIPGEHTKE